MHPQDTTVPPGMVAIYALCEPHDPSIIRYIGKAKTPRRRLYEHIRRATDPDESYRNRWLRKLRRQGVEPVLSILGIVPEDQWQEEEVRWMAHYRARGMPLTNLAPGGGAPPSPRLFRKSWPRGEAHPLARLSAEAVRDIWERHAAGASHAELAALFGVSDVAIWSVISGRTWGHVLHDAERVAYLECRARHVRPTCTPARYAEIRARYAAGGMAQHELGREYGLSRSAINHILNDARGVAPAREVAGQRRLSPAGHANLSRAGLANSGRRHGEDMRRHVSEAVRRSWRTRAGRGDATRSGVRGITYVSDPSYKKRWLVRVTIEGQRIGLGTFASIADAVQARDAYLAAHASAKT